MSPSDEEQCTNIALQTKIPLQTNITLQSNLALQRTQHCSQKRQVEIAPNQQESHFLCVKAL